MSKRRSLLSGGALHVRFQLPVDKLFSSYDAIFDSFKEIARTFAESERSALFHDNAARFYRL